MKRLQPKRALVAIASGLLVSVPWTIASCATTEESAPIPEATHLIPEAGGADSGASFDADAEPENACDASEPNCVTKPTSCSEAAWCPVATGVSELFSLTTVWGAGRDDVWAAGSGGTIVHWNGAGWSPVPTPEPRKNTFRVIWGSGPKDVWVASATDLIFHSEGFANGSASWSLVPSPTDEYNTAPIYSGWGTAAGAPRFGTRVYTRVDAEGNYGPGNQIVGAAQNDGGVAWVLEKGTATVKGIWGSSADDIWLVGDNSDAVSWQLGWTVHGVRGSGGDLVWTEVDSQASVVLEAIWGSSAGDVWAVGDTGTIRHIAAGGTRWEIVASPTHEPLHAVWGATPNDVWAIGDTGTILHWDGSSWKPSLAAFPVNRTRPHLYGIWGSGPNDVWIVGEGIALRYTGGEK